MPTPNDKLLASNRAVIQALGDVYCWLVEKYDPYRKERDLPTNIYRELVCQVCTIASNRTKEVSLQVAHIEAVEECGRTVKENLITLCTRKGDLGCHTLYDGG